MTKPIAIALLLLGICGWARMAAADMTRRQAEPNEIAINHSQLENLDHLLHGPNSSVRSWPITVAQACSNGYSHTCRNNYMTCYIDHCGSMGSDCCCPSFCGWFSGD